MSYRVRIEPDHLLDGVAVTVVAQHASLSQALNDEGRWETLTPGVDSTSPAFRWDEALARELFNALLDYYGGLPADRQLRKDYDHERGRVDMLVDALLAKPQVVYVDGQVTRVE